MHDSDMPHQQYHHHGCMDVRFAIMPLCLCIDGDHHRADEAGLYLSTFKQFEHKPPDLIKERVDKDYNSVLRTALTSISKVNKTDVETLRTSIGASGVTSSQKDNGLTSGVIFIRASQTSRKRLRTSFRTFLDSDK
jgi:hypothetical protein